jgi:hypothetical protein
MPDTNSILKYLKVKALADRGDPGERDNAARILKRIVAENPGIEKAAARYLRQKEKEENGGPDPYPTGFGAGSRSGAREVNPFTGLGGNWEDIFNFARGVVNNAYDFANTVANAYAGRLLAEDHVDASTRSTRAGNVHISLRMSLATYNHAQRLNMAQKEAFRQAMHEMLQEELDGMLGETDAY